MGVNTLKRKVSLEVGGWTLTRRLQILVVAGLELRNRWQVRNHPELQSYYRVKPSQRITIAVLYFGLAILLVVGMHATHVPRDLFK